MTNTASFDLDAYLPAARLRNRTLNKLEVSAWFTDLHYFHKKPLSSGNARDEVEQLIVSAEWATKIQ